MARGFRWIGLRLLLLLILLPSLPVPTATAQTSFTAPSCDSAAAVTEQEPNNQPPGNQVMAGTACAAGNWTDSQDYDFFAWDLTPEQSLQRWTIELDGDPADSLIIAVYQIEFGDDGTTPRTARQLAQALVLAGPGHAELSDLFWRPGRLYVGVATSGSGPYRLQLHPGAGLPDVLDTEPNNTAEVASQVSAGFAVSGDRAESIDSFAWTLDADAATHGYALDFQTFVGDTGYLYIKDSSGQTLSAWLIDSLGKVATSDVHLPPSTYSIEVPADSAGGTPYVLAMRDQGPQPADAESEPNETQPLGTLIAPSADSTVINGRLGTVTGLRDDVDAYRLLIDDAHADRVTQIKLFWRNGLDRQLCLFDAQGNPMTCARGTQNAVLRDLVLPAGEYGLTVTGYTDATDPYLLRVDISAALPADYENEPNNEFAAASMLETAGTEFHGTGSLIPSDYDYYRATITGEPQLWQVVVEGSGFRRVEALDASGRSIAFADRNETINTATITNILLRPGDHWFAISGESGDYTVRLVPLGPPPPNSEQEPNSTIDGAQRMLMGDERSGQLLDQDDQDIYRFSLLSEEHVILRLESPDDGSFNMRLAWGATQLPGLGGVAEPGTPLVYDALLKPGDYLITLDAVTPSTGFYHLTLNRADPFVLPADLEPNNAAPEASPIRVNQQIEGIAVPTASGQDDDWYVIPAGNAARTLSIDLESDPNIYIAVDAIALRSDTAPETTLALTRQEANSLGGSVDLPAGQPLAIGISGEGAYRLTISDGTAPAYVAPGELPVKVEVTLPETPVAAYWSDAQQIEGAVTLTNTGSAPVDLALDAAVSDYRWTIAFGSDQVTLAAGESKSIPATITVGPDAWADLPVRITVRAADPDGRVASGYVETTPDREAPPVNPLPGSTLTPELRGGLNVAWDGFGATPVKPDQRLAEYEAMLYDGISSHVRGWWDYHSKAAATPIELTVDLAGDEPIPISGIILNPFGDTGDPGSGLRQYELQLSTDGQSYETVLSGEVSALPVDQSFVLDKPIEARFARLRVISNQLSTARDEIVIGEWKVIAEPGWTFPNTVDAVQPVLAPNIQPTPVATAPEIPDAAGFEISMPERGGHVVYTDPQLGSMDWAEALVRPGGGETNSIVVDNPQMTWVVGFQHDRAAQISIISWDGPEEIDPNRPALIAFEVSVSTESPTGPWESLGTWTLDSADADVLITLDDPVWARYVRFTATSAVPEGAVSGQTFSAQFPGATRIFERPAGDEYQSILAEWGQDSRMAIYEQLVPSIAPEIDADAGNSADEATLLPIDQTHTDTAQTEKDEDWYEVRVPADSGVLRFTLTGAPTVDVAPTLFDDAGNEVPLQADDGQRERTYEATVIPGGTYRLRVIKPPTALVVAFDMSGSMGAYLDMIFNGVGVYSEAVVPGLEVVNFLPFGESALLPEMSGDPAELQTAITNYPRTASSSDSESSMLTALTSLEGQPGTRAILLLTDAESGSYGSTTELWQELGIVQTRIFTVQIGAGSDIPSQQDLMQDWADANQGIYHYVRAQSDVDVAFDRTATILRRPSLYSVSVEAIALPPTPTPSPTSTPEPTATPSPSPTPSPTVPPEPGTIRVIPPKQQAEGPAPVAPDVSVALILDTSGSMLQGLEGSTRAQVAKGALTNLVTDTLPPGTNVSLRSFGNTPDSCETRLVVPRGPLDPVAMTAQIDALEVVNLVRTPIGASLEAVAGDLGAEQGPKIVVLVTDGEETCGGDPEAAIRALIAQGIDVHVNIVGFALDDQALKDQFKRWAKIGNGQYIDAANSAELSAAVTKVVQPVYRVIDANGEVVATGQVGGPSLRVPAGTYTVEVLTDSVQRYENVEVKPGERTTVRMKAPKRTSIATYVVIDRRLWSGGYFAAC